MRLPLRTPRRVAVAFGLLWLAGVAVIWRLMPVGPRDGWQPPTDEFACGFLSDGRTLVTVPRASHFLGPDTGPVRLWDIETGQLRANQFGFQDLFYQVRVLPGPDLLQLVQRAVGPSEGQSLFHYRGLNFPVASWEPPKWERADAGEPEALRLRLLDARTGREVASFPCHLAQGRHIDWVVTPDGQTSALLTYDQGQPYVEWYDVPSGRRRGARRGCGGPLCFSPDGRRLAMCDRDGVVVYEVATGRALARPAFRDPAGRALPRAYPKGFSPDGQLLLDSQGNVWDLATGAHRFGVSPPGVSTTGDEFTFTPDGQLLAAVRQTTSACWLAFYDVSTGVERIDKRVPLAARACPEMSLTKGTPDGRLLLAVGIHQFGQPTAAEEWLAKAPGLGWLKDFRSQPAYVLVETGSGREVARGSEWVWTCTPDGRYLLSYQWDLVSRLWDVPPRKPLRWLLPAWAALTLAIGLPGWRLIRRARRTSAVRSEATVTAVP